MATQDLGLEFEERQIGRTELYAAEEMFLCGTGAQVTPVRSVDRRPVGNGKVGAITKKLGDHFQDVVHGRVEPRRELVDPRLGMKNPVIGARWIILALFAALCVWLVPGVQQLQHDDDVLAFLPPEHPDVIAFNEVADRFGMLQVALVGLRKGGEDLLAPETTEEVRELGTSVATADGVQLVLSYPDLPDPKVEGETLVVEPLVPKGLSAEEIRERTLKNPNAVGNLISPDGTAAVLLVYLLPDSDVSNRGKNLAAIRELVTEQWSGEAYFGGGPFVEDTAAASSRTDIEGLSPIVILVLVVASAALLGSATGAALNLIVTGLGVALVVGAHGRFAEPFTIVSSTTPVMMVALGGAFGMHIIAGYQRQDGTPVERASKTVRELWLPVVLSGVTTATAFFALVVMPQVPMQRFGVVAGCGVLLLLVLALLVLPSLLSLLPARLLPTRTGRKVPLRWVPPLWLLGAAGSWGGGARGAAGSRPGHAERVRRGERAAPRGRVLQRLLRRVPVRSDRDRGRPRGATAVRAIRDMADEIRTLDHVADVRSLYEPVALVTEGFGGRAGVPRTYERGKRVVSNLADQAAMKQLMTTDWQGAIIHVKLAPASSEEQLAVTAKIRRARRRCR